MRKLIFHPCLDFSWLSYLVCEQPESTQMANKLSVSDFIQVLALTLIHTLIWEVLALSQWFDF